MPEPQKLKKLTTEALSDYHCHCNYSIDAEGTIDEYCEAAITRGLKELCFTTHYDINPDTTGDGNLIRVDGEEIPATPENLAPYVDDVRRAAKSYSGQGLTVKLGVEFGYYPGCEESARKIKERYELDYLLCGIHELNNICFCCRHEYGNCYKRFSLEQMLEAYFTDMISAAKSGVFDTIAHFDYYKKYGSIYYGPDVFTAHRPFLPDVFSACLKGHTAIEINTAALRRGFDTHYPSLEIIRAAKEAGVNVVRLGSDAHKPEHVGWDFDNANQLRIQSVSQVRV
ncbi:MAG: histidinol-phosphatase [candidate division Zixibacteria bacterium]|nr:histidinol-phosphatase [candidate division Zixibacteria bacterium]